MEDSILKSTKKILGLAEDYTAFDLDVITHINMAMSILDQIGIGPRDGFFIEDDSANWADIDLPQKDLAMVRSYVYLRVRKAFDPPQTSFHIESMDNQIRELEERLSISREEAMHGG
jgi:hypothetical protein